MSENILKIRDLSVNYHTDRGKLKALRHVNLDIPKGSIAVSYTHLRAHET